MTTQFYYRSKISSVLLHNKRYVKQDFHQTFMHAHWAKSVLKTADFLAFSIEKVGQLHLYLLAPVQVCPLPEWVFEGFSLDTRSLDHLVEEKRQLPWMAPGTSVAGTGGAPGFHRGCGEA